MRELSIAFQTDKSAARCIALAQFVNRYPFDGVSVYCDAPFQPSYAPLLLMAPHLERARLGPAAIPLARMHPLDIAANAALLAELARGGTTIGLARGAWLEQYALHEPQPPLVALREALHIITALLSGQEAPTGGVVYPLGPHLRAPYPVPDGLPRLLIGTWGRRLAAIAGELADEVKVGGSANPAFVPVMAGYIAEGERAAGRTPGTVGICVGAVSVIDEDRQAARAAARRAVALYLPVVAPLDPTVQVDPALIARLRAHADQGETDAAAQLISDDLLERFAFAGSPNDIIRQCEALFAAGARRIEFGTPHGLAQAESGIRLLGERVLPALQQG